jgi:hypothetical protein
MPGGKLFLSDALRIVGFIILPDWMAKPFQEG